MKYKIWNKEETLFTPVKSFSPEEYMADHAPWAAIPGIKCVIADAPINCSIFAEFEVFKESYRQMGAAFDDTMSDQEVLDAISDFEEQQREVQREAASTPTAEERMAAAMEFQNLMTMMKEE